MRCGTAMPIGSAVPLSSRPDPEEVHYQLLKLIEHHPGLTQREASERLGISLGKVNYCFRALIDKGHIKLGNFRRSREKQSYAYLLTPAGMEAKAKAAMHFLLRKMEEYELLKRQIDALNAELSQNEYLEKAKSS